MILILVIIIVVFLFLFYTMRAIAQCMLFEPETKIGTVEDFAFARENQPQEYSEYEDSESDIE